MNETDTEVMREQATEKFEEARASYLAGLGEEALIAWQEQFRETGLKYGICCGVPYIREPGDEEA